MLATDKSVAEHSFPTLLPLRRTSLHLPSQNLARMLIHLQGVRHYPLMSRSQGDVEDAARSNGRYCVDERRARHLARDRGVSPRCEEHDRALPYSGRGSR
jgi:hypothetical protein